MIRSLNKTVGTVGYDDMSQPTNGTVVAVNHNLGIFVVEAADATCMILEAVGRLAIDVGDTVNADWPAPDFINVANLSQNCEMQAKVQRTGTSRGDAISSMAVI